MRLARFRLDAWGHYDRGVALEFPPRARDLHVVRGDNEAGKSTLLDGLTSLLFGIERGTPRAFQWGEPNLSLSGEGTLADGRPLTWSRRGGRKAPFTGVIGDTPLDPQRLAALLGGVDRARWAALFGFSGEQLARAGEELKQIPLSQVVSGATDPRKVAADLINDADALYKGGNRAKNPRVNTEAAQIRELERRAQAASVLPRQWRELETAEAQARTALAAAHERLRRAEAHLHRAARRESAWALLVEKARLSEERTALGPPTGLAPGDRLVYEELARRRDELGGTLATLKATLATRAAERAAIHLPVEILAAAADIDRLVADRRARSEDVDRLGKLVGQLREQRTALDVRIAALLSGTQGGVERLAAIPTDAGTRARLAGLARTAAEIEQRRARAINEQTRLAGARAALQERLGRLPPEVDVSGLEALVERGGAIRELRRTLAQDREALERLSAPLAQQRILLAAAWPEGRPAPEAPPAPAEAEEADRELTRLRKRVDDAEAARAAADAERARHRAELAALDRQRELPTPERLAALRADRADAWDGVRRALLVGPPPPPMHAQALVNPFEAAMLRADEHADAMYAEAQAVARRVHLSALVEHADGRVAELGTAVQVASDAFAEFSAGWASRCEAGGLLAVSPGVLRAWLRDYAAWRTTAAERDRLDARVMQAETEVAGFEAQVRAASPDAGAALPPDVRLRQIDARVRAASVAAGERNGLSEQAVALARDEAALDDTRRLLEDDEGRLAASSTEARTALDLPPDLPVAEWPAWLNDVQVGQETLRRLAALEAEEAATRARLAAWEEEVRTHLSPLISLPAGTPSVACVEAAARSLTDARRLRDQAKDHDAVLPRLHEEVSTATATLASVVSRLVAERARTGAPDDATWLAQAEAAERAAAIEPALGRLDAALNQLRADADEAAVAFDASVLAAGAEALRAEHSAAEAEQQACAAGVDTATRAHQDAHAALARVDTSASAAWLRTEAEEQRQRLRSGVEEWVTLQLASRLLTEALRRYEAGEEPAVYRRTGELFQRMTGGRYTEVRPVGGHHLLHAWRVHGEELDSAQLSEGTRQQLYLAARLAWAERHCAHHEPLPLVLDDVLAAFDDTRATATIRVLAELSERVQVILLTHHPHVSDLVCAAEPSVAPVRLTSPSSA